MSMDLLKKAVNALDSKKGIDIKIIDIKEVSSLTDYFVICSGSSTTQVKALADEVEFVLGGYETGMDFHKEGYAGGNWILLDYKHIVVNVFTQETRDFYNLERLWTDGKEVDIKTLLEEEK